MHNFYAKISSIESIFQAWNEFKIGKRNRKDVQIFERNLEDNLFILHRRIVNKTYKHGTYVAFNIYDPKFRHIHKAKVEDRIVHHAAVSIIEPLFDKSFIYDSYSCRDNKGMHRAVKRLYFFVRKVSKNYSSNCFALKLDVRKFFESVDHNILLNLLKKKIKDEDFISLIKNILDSFSKEKGIPIGNLTSQIFANVYLNELDKFMKQELRIKYYIRYCDDFVILSKDRKYLENLIVKIGDFLNRSLKLSLHENKMIICKYVQGIDFLGYIILPHFILPRTKTRKRAFRKMYEKSKDLKNGVISQYSFNQTVQSYLGYFKHADSYELRRNLRNYVRLSLSQADGLLAFSD